MDERDINLRPFILPLVARWNVIALVAFGVALVGALLSFVLAPGYTATADTLIRPMQTRPSFDPRFPNQDTEEAVRSTDQGRQKALTALAVSSLLEERVLDVLPENLMPEGYEPGVLARKFSVSVQGEIIRISSTHKDEQSARTLADTWAQAYVDMVNTVYSGVVLDQVAKELGDAQTRYDESQKALEAFIQTNDLTALNRQIEILQTLLADSRASTLEQFRKYLERARHKEDFLLEAREVQRQIEVGQTGNLGNILIALTLRSRFGANASSPFQLQLQRLDELDDDHITVADVDELIGIAEEQRDDLVQQHQQLARDATSGDVESIALPLTLRDDYEQQLRDLQVQLEQQTARQQLLTQSRDIALETLTTLKKKT
ncbi:MAG: hypothetical protein HC876_22950, partial [Chloroflexaceae bacterium]|nr:hypothetical protein [Chloroflexaceae bacterium]